ncbi:hypothetical protein [Tenacibaculum discolor]|uniref:hypothetical protein n=1 Tax=Tenacibaculum discolor TaxID=361581 RepID=UPI003F7AA6AB
MSENSRIKIKMGAIEVECEGSESFLKDELPELIKSVSEMYNNSNHSLSADESVEMSSIDVSSQNQLNGTLNIGTTGSVAAKLSVKSGSELLIAAAARLTFGLAKSTFTRKEVLTEMKSATSYYKTSYGANLTKYLSSAVKDGKFLETSKGVYAIQATVSTSLKSRLA